MKKVVLTTLSIIALIVGCKKAVEPEAVTECSNDNNETPVQRANYPISVGSYWIYDTYKVIDSSGVETLIRASDTTKVIGDTSLNGEVYSVFRGINYPIQTQKYNWYLRDSSQYIINNLGKITYGSWDVLDTINKQEQNFSTVLIWWSFSGIEEQVTVGAGLFNAKRLRTHFMYADGSSISQCLNDSVSHNAGAYFYAEEVGLIQKNIGYASVINCNHFESRLKEYYIAP